MDVEKASSKGHGFFSLFDWSKNKKSKKRLFSGSGGDYPNPRSIRDEKEVDGGAPTTRPNSVLEDALSMKESSEHSCSSSVIDEETQARRCPTVVARLMGLDSMPPVSLSESNPLPLAVQPPFLTNSHENLVGKSCVDSPLKMPSSPIDRFKMEALPPRYAKRTLPVAQYKLLSPMKNSNPISSRNAADIMEAASRIIGTGVENIIPYRVNDVGHTNAVRPYNPREIIGVQQRSHKLNEELRKRGGSASSRPPSGKPLDGVSESTSSSRISVSRPVGPKIKASNRDSNIARAVQAQGKEQTRKTSRKPETLSRNPENRMALRNGLNQQNGTNRMGSTRSSYVLVPNNRKQNAMVTKHKLDSKPSTASQQRSNTHQRNASPRKVGATHTSGGNMTQGNRKVDLQTSHSNMRTPTAKGIPKPRRLQERRIYSDKSLSSDDLSSDRRQRRIRHNIVIDDQSAFSTNKKKINTEIVSFTFTSPVDKSLHDSLLPNHSTEKQLAENLNAMSTSNDTSDAKLDVIDGDYLGLLLERKLSELTSGVKSPYLKPSKGVRISAPSPVLEDTGSGCETSSITSTDYDRVPQSFNDGKSTLSQKDSTTTNGQSSQSLKYNNDVADQAELEQLHLSPLSTWEASLSTETCSSSESWRSANGTRLFSSADGATTSESTRFNKSLEVDASSEYSDTASSMTVATAEIPRSDSSSSSCHMDDRQEVEFIRDILNAASMSRIFSRLERFDNSDILDRHLLEELDGHISLVVGEGSKAYRLRRVLLFDCVNELLSVKCAYYFNAGYSSWYTGMAILQNLSADELHREMTSLKVAEEWMVDELVYKEMSTPLGSWVDFKVESYQVAGDVAMELLGSLVDEVVADLLTGSVL